MGNSLYAFIAFISLLVFGLIFRCFKKINNSEDEHTNFEHLLIYLIIFAACDGIWGLLDSKVLDFGVTGFYIASFCFHFFATIISYLWYSFSSGYLNYKKNMVIRILEAIPVFAGAAVVVYTTIKGTLFYIDTEGVYHGGTMRPIIFHIQYFYYLYGFVRVLLHCTKKAGRASRTRNFVAIEYMLVNVFMGLMQFLFPNSPYYSAGFLLAAIVIFNGSIVIDRDKDNRQKVVSKEKESEEIMGALKALADGFVSIHLFNVPLNKQVMVKSTPNIEQFVHPEDGADEQIKNVMMHVTEPEFREKIVDFVDLSTLSERMKGRRVLTEEFIGISEGWCLTSFIKVEEDEEGNVVKCIHAVQNVNERKKREEEFAEALKRAYQNENAIYAELIKMQSVGVIATDSDGKLILANDMALDMFNHSGTGEEYKKHSYDELVADSDFVDTESATENYYKLVSEGIPFTYVLQTNNEAAGTRFLRGDARRVDLLDGSKVVVTCYTDITESKKVEDNLRMLSSTDALTRIDNRRSGESKIRFLLNEKSSGGLFCLLDINKFKAINDTFGHQVGDRALVATAKAIKDSFRDNDIVMRIGGDEFAIYAENITTKEMAQASIQRLFRRIEAISIAEMQGMPITISLGAVFVKPGAVGTFDELYHDADEIMYECKNKEGNNFAL